MVVDHGADGPSILSFVAANRPSSRPKTSDLPKSWIGKLELVRNTLLPQLELPYGCADFLDACRWLAVVCLAEGLSGRTRELLREYLRTPGSPRAEGAMKVLSYLTVFHVTVEELESALAHPTRSVRNNAVNLIHFEGMAASLGGQVAEMAERMIGTADVDEEWSCLGSVLGVARGPKVLAILRRLLTECGPTTLLWGQAAIAVREWRHDAASLKDILEERAAEGYRISTRLECIYLLLLITGDDSYREQFIALAETAFAVAKKYGDEFPHDFAIATDTVVLDPDHPVADASFAVSVLQADLYADGFRRIIQLTCELRNAGVLILALSSAHSFNPQGRTVRPLFQTGLSLALSVPPVPETESSLVMTLLSVAQWFVTELADLREEFERLRAYCPDDELDRFTTLMDQFP